MFRVEAPTPGAKHIFPRTGKPCPGTNMSCNTASTAALEHGARDARKWPPRLPPKPHVSHCRLAHRQPQIHRAFPVIQNHAAQGIIVKVTNRQLGCIGGLRGSCPETAFWDPCGCASRALNGPVFRFGMTLFGSRRRKARSSSVGS